MYGLVYNQRIFLECPPETIRLVSTDDIKDANVTMGTGFKNVLTTSTLMEEAFRYFLETAVPNTGEILFKEEFLLTGITTAGFKLNSTDPDRFVSNFTFLYSSFTTGPFQKYEMVRMPPINIIKDLKTFKAFVESFQIGYTLCFFHAFPVASIICKFLMVSFVVQCFTPDNAMETAYFLSNPLLARRIRLIVNDAELGLGTYYWRINLFGCSEEDGITIIVITYFTNTVLRKTLHADVTQICFYDNWLFYGAALLHATGNLLMVHNLMNHLSLGEPNRRKCACHMPTYARQHEVNFL